MPCRTDYVNAKDFEGHFRHNGETAQMLCHVLHVIEDADILKDIEPNIWPVVIEWYKEHKEMDMLKAEVERKRLEGERERLNNENLKKEALSKLTEAEKKSIGVKIARNIARN